MQAPRTAFARSIVAHMFAGTFRDYFDAIEFPLVGTGQSPSSRIHLEILIPCWRSIAENRGPAVH